MLSPSVVEHLPGDDTVWEQAPVRELAAAGQLAYFKHEGFWQAMDGQRASWPGYWPAPSGNMPT